MGLILLVSVVFVALAGVSLAMGQSRRLLSLRQNAVRAGYLAQAGIMRALYDIRLDDGIRLAEYVVDPGPAPGSSDDDVFLLSGTAADFLLVNMLPATVDQGDPPGGVKKVDRLDKWELYNVLHDNSPPDGLPLVVTHVTVSWASPQAGEGVIRIELKDKTVWPPSGQTGPPQPSGTELDVTAVKVQDRTIPPGKWRTKNTIWFSTEDVMEGKAFIDIALRMSDDVAGGDPAERSVRVARYAAAAAARSAEFTVKATGETRRGTFPFVVWRRLAADYRITHKDLDKKEGALVSYRELSRKTP